MIFSLEKKVEEMHQRVHFLMKDRNLSGSEISKFIIPSSNIPNFFSKWSANKSGMTLKRAFFTVEVLDTSMDYFLVGRGSSFRMSNLYSSILSIDEKDLFVSFQNLSHKDKELFLQELKSIVPKNAFFKSNFIEQADGDYEVADLKLSELLSNLGPKLKEYLKEKKIHQKLLSEHLQNDPALINRYIKGLRIIPIEKLIVICNLLEILPSQLIFPEVEPDAIPGLSKMNSDLIVYYRMLTQKEKGKFLALARGIEKGIVQQKIIDK